MLVTRFFPLRAWDEPSGPYNPDPPPRPRRWPVTPPLQPRAFRAGYVAWRIGARGHALRCVVVNTPSGDGFVEVRSSSLSRNTMRVAAADLFTERALCRHEIHRRRVAQQVIR